jgi:ribosomal protein L29
MSFKMVGIILLALVVAFGAGWAVGSSGRGALELERSRGEIRAEFAEARALVFAGRVSLYESNFGTAVGHFQEARRLVAVVQTRLRENGLVDQAGRLESALSHLGDAQRGAAAFDIAAHGSADQAMTVLDAVRRGA